jgi:hypothetical protein
MAKAKTKDDDGLALFDAPTSEKTTITHENPAVPAAVIKAPRMPTKKQMAALEAMPKRAGAIVAPQPENGTLALLQTVERLSTNKDTNPAIVEMLLKEMRDLRAEQARAVFDAQMAMMQGELPIVDRRGKIVVREKDARGERTGKVTQSTPYALYEDIIEDVLPILSKYGFSITHITDTEEKVRVESILSGHGFERRTKLTLMHDSTGSKNSVQAVVSSVSYAKRINLCALVSLATRGEDDDGAGAGRPLVTGEPITSEQLGQLVDLREAVDCKPDYFLKGLNQRRPNGHPEIAKLDDLPAARFDEAIAMLRSFEANRKARDEKTAQGAQA